MGYARPATRPLQQAQKFSFVSGEKLATQKRKQGDAFRLVGRYNRTAFIPHGVIHERELTEFRIRQGGPEGYGKLLAFPEAVTLTVARMRLEVSWQMRSMRGIQTPYYGESEKAFRPT